MNPRFEELYKSCRSKEALASQEQVQSANVLLGTEVEKFAELIVKECIGCCEQVISDPVPESVDTWLNGGTQCMAEIKQHFGVEE